MRNLFLLAGVLLITTAVARGQPSSPPPPAAHVQLQGVYRQGEPNNPRSTISCRGLTWELDFSRVPNLAQAAIGYQGRLVYVSGPAQAVETPNDLPRLICLVAELGPPRNDIPGDSAVLVLRGQLQYPGAAADGGQDTPPSVRVDGFNWKLDLGPRREFIDKLRSFDQRWVTVTVTPEQTFSNGHSRLVSLVTAFQPDPSPRPPRDRDREMDAKVRLVNDIGELNIAYRRGHRDQAATAARDVGLGIVFNYDEGNWLRCRKPPGLTFTRAALERLEANGAIRFVDVPRRASIHTTALSPR